MKKKISKSNTITLVIILVIAIISTLALTKPESVTKEELIKCIGKNSVLYTQIGCTHCKTQENLFGENYKFLTVIDCFYDREICSQKGIPGTPSWIINDKLYLGVQSIDKLKELTKC